MAPYEKVQSLVPGFSSREAGEKVSTGQTKSKQDMYIYILNLMLRFYKGEHNGE